jgi:putative PEP-CTERM system TPR-repeat lipoprotein
MRFLAARSWVGPLAGILLLSACDLFVSAEARVDRAAERMETGDYRSAVIELKNALQEDPDNVDARLLLARASLQLGDLAAAQKELDRAVEAGATPQRVGTLRYEVLVARRQFRDALTFLDTDGSLGTADRLYYTSVAEAAVGNLEQAASASENLRIQFPDDPRGYLTAAEILAGQGRGDEALAEVRKALELDPQNPLALFAEGRLHIARSRWDEAERALTAASESKPPLDATTQAAVLAGLTEAYFGQQKLDAAAATIKRLEKIAPEAVGTHILRARLALEQDRPADAVSELQPVVQSLPDYAPAHVLMGMALLNQRRYDQAEKTLQRILQRVPDNAEARRLLAQVQLLLGRPQAAVDSLESLLEGDAPDARTDWLMGQAKMRSGSGAEAVELLERSARSEPGNVRLQVELAGAYIELGRPADAIKLLESLPEGAADGRRESLLVLAYAAQGSKGYGRPAIEKLATQHADDAQLLTIIASFMRRTGDVEAARRYLNQAIEAAPGDVAPLLALASLEHVARNMSAARDALLRARNLDGGNEVAALGLARIALDEGSASTAREILGRAVAANARGVRVRLALAQLELESGIDDRAEELFDEVLSLADDRSDGLVAVAGVQLRAKRLAEGIDTLKEALVENPKNADALYALGAAQVANKDPGAGRRNLEAAAAARPSWIQPAMLLTMLDVQAGRTDEALARARKARAAQPGDVTAIALEADVLAAAGKTDEALAAYADAQKARPTARVAMRMMQLRVAGKLPQPEAPLVDYLAAVPNDVIVRRALAERYQANQRRAEAIAEYEQLLAISPRDAEATNNLAWLYYETGDSRAEATARAATELSPGSGLIADTLGWILVEKGEIKEGLRVLEQAAEQSPENRDVRFHLAAALARNDKEGEAVSVLKKLLDSDGKFPSRAEAEKLLKELEG